MRELLLIFNDMSKATLESKIHSKVGQTSWNLKEKNTPDTSNQIIVIGQKC